MGFKKIAFRIGNNENNNGKAIMARDIGINNINKDPKANIEWINEMEIDIGIIMDKIR